MAERDTIASLRIDVLRDQVAQSTAALLGDTITVTDEAWRGPSLLPGWSRAHVATHVARNADGLARLAHNVATGGDLPMYPTDRDAEIQAGADRDGLALQEDLDASATALDAAFDAVPEAGWDQPIQIRDGSRFPARMLLLMRINEVELHRVDLDLGRTCADIPDELAGWMIAWSLERLLRRDPSLDLCLVSVDGARFAGGAREVRGSRQALLAWLTGRPAAGPVAGAEGLEVPAL